MDFSDLYFLIGTLKKCWLELSKIPKNSAMAEIALCDLDLISDYLYKAYEKYLDETAEEYQ